MRKTSDTKKISLCVSGELCQGKGHLKQADRYVPCTCYYLKRRRNRCIAGGIPESMIDLELSAAMKATARHVLPETIRAVCKTLMSRETPTVFIETFKDKNGDVDTMPLAAWFASQIALEEPVHLIRFHDLIDARFDKDQFEVNPQKLVRQSSAIILRIGHDIKHAWNASFLVDIITNRHARRERTILSVAAPLSQSLEALYGPAVMQEIYRKVVFA